MARGVNIKEIAKLIDCEDIFDPVWFNWSFDGGWGSRLTKYKKKKSANGTFTPGIDRTVSIQKVYKKLQNNDFTEISGFYTAILCFYGEKIYPKLDFVEKMPNNPINRVVKDLICPEEHKDKIKEICYSKYNFEDFISAAAKLKKTNFDGKSALSVYKLQGDAAIFPLLCQMFYNNKGIEQLNPCLINNIPINFNIEVSKYLSGCYFPVVVSPMGTDFKWEENQNGWFFYTFIEKEWRTIDTAGVGRFNLSNYSLGNRLNYISGGGKTVPYLICWNWGDIIEAYHHFGQDLLIRDLKNDLFHNYWFIFGPESLLNVRFKDGFINFDKDLQVLPNFNSSLISVDKNRGAYLTVDLNGNFIDYCDKKDVFYSDSEVFDWFELGEMLK